jgi:hypothetical protein
MTRPYASDARSTVVERPAGRLGKRAPWLSSQVQCACGLVSRILGLLRRPGGAPLRSV